MSADLEVSPSPETTLQEGRDQRVEAPYALAHHVHLCCKDGHVVVLDAKANRYFAFAISDDPNWPNFILGLQTPTEPLGRVEQPALPGPAVRALLKKEIIVARGHGKPAVPVSTPEPRESLAALSLDEERSIRIGALFGAARAVLWARLYMRFWGLHRTLDAIARRNEALRARSTTEDQTRLATLVEDFTLCKPYLFKAKDECLFESIALWKFLTSDGVVCDLIIGVRTRPFAAHCWLQSDATVLNDYVDRVRTYTPLLAI